MSTRHDVTFDIIGGLVAGVAATWVMGQATTYLYSHEAPAARRREDEARGGDTAYGRAAAKIAAAVGVQLSPEQRRGCGASLHWAQGAAAGLAFALLQRRTRTVPRGSGLLFGLALWAAMDEGALWAAGVTPGPLAFPWQTHARGLAGHLVFGGATEAALDLLHAAA
ncbi:MAG: hypothetical protein ACM3NQ_09360 [Bacteroidales bacterium]